MICLLSEIQIDKRRPQRYIEVRRRAQPPKSPRTEEQDIVTLRLRLSFIPESQFQEFGEANESYLPGSVG